MFKVCLLFCSLSLVVQDDALEKENAKLRSQIRALERKLEQAEQAGFYYSDKGYSSVLAMVKDLPKEFEVQSGTVWDASEFTQAQEELKTLAIGKPFAAKHRVEVSYSINQANLRNPELPKYKIKIAFEPVLLPYRGKTFRQKLYDIEFKGNDEAVEHAKSIHGRLIKIEGVVSSIRLTIDGVGDRSRMAVYVGLTQSVYKPNLLHKSDDE